MDQSHEYKTSKYEALKKEQKKEGYSVIMKAMEIRARGFVAGTLYQFLSQISIKECNRAKCIKCLIEIVENNSMWIWKKRNIQWNNSKWSSLNCHSIANAWDSPNILIMHTVNFKSYFTVTLLNQHLSQA